MMQIKEIRKNLAETIKNIRSNFDGECTDAVISDLGYSLALCDLLDKNDLKHDLLEKYDYPT